MSKKQADVVKKANKKAEGASLKARIESLEEEMEVMKKVVRGLVAAPGPAAKSEKEGKKVRKELDEHLTGGTTETKDVKVLLNELAAAKKAGDKQTAFKIRGRLRKAGYSLRVNSKK